MNFLKKLFQILIVLVVVFVIGFTAFWFSRTADISFEEHKAKIPHSEYSKFVDVDGIKLHYQEKGEGTPIVLIHGYTSLSYTWKDVFEPLSKQFRVIAVDLKGFGFSDKPDGNYRRSEQAKLVRNFLKTLKIEKAWLAGNSMGGEVSINVALQEPELVEGLILLDSSGVSIETKGTESPSNRFDIPFVGRALASVVLLSDSLVREGLERSYFDDSKVTDETVEIYHLPLQANNGQRAAFLAKNQWDFESVEAELNKIEKPTLILWGDKDEVTPLEGGKKINRLIKDSKLVVFENIGHLPQEETPEKVVEEILKFTDKTE